MTLNVVRAIVAMLAGISMTVSAQQAGDDLVPDRTGCIAARKLQAECESGWLSTDKPGHVRNPAILGFMHSLIFPSSGESTPSPASERARLFVGSASARAAAVDVGYAASYQEMGGSPEIGVFALRLKDPSAAPNMPVTVPSAQRITRGSVIIFSWSDAHAGAPDRGCVNVIRRHVESVDVT
jgi:hypothetical protein